MAVVEWMDGWIDGCERSARAGASVRYAGSTMRWKVSVSGCMCAEVSCSSQSWADLAALRVKAKERVCDNGREERDRACTTR